MNAVLSSSTALANLMALVGKGGEKQDGPTMTGNPFAALLAETAVVEASPHAVVATPSAILKTGIAFVDGAGEAMEHAQAAEAETDSPLPPGIARLLGLPVTPRGKGRDGNGKDATGEDAPVELVVESDVPQAKSEGETAPPALPEEAAATPAETPAG